MTLSKRSHPPNVSDMVKAKGQADSGSERVTREIHSSDAGSCSMTVIVWTLHKAGLW